MDTKGNTPVLIANVTLQQICYIMLASWSYDGSQIMLHTVKDPANVTNPAALTHYIPNMEWKLIDFKYTVNLK